MAEEPRWIELTVDCPSGLVTNIQSHMFALHAAGSEEAFREGEHPPVRQPWDTHAPGPKPARRLVRGWFENGDGELLIQTIIQQLGSSAADVTVHWTHYEPVDWQAQSQAQHPVIHVSDRLCICPPWDIRERGIIIEPGIGFGTGAHPTTLQALKALDCVADRYQTALDVGCGSGILALAAAKLGLTSCGFDIEEPAVHRAIAHADQNQLDVSFSTTLIQDWSAPADIVLANLHAELLLSLHHDLIRLTNHVLITAGIMESKAHSVFDTFSPYYSQIERSQDGEWVSFVFKHPTSRHATL